MIKLQLKNSPECKGVSLSELERLMGIEWLNALNFPSDKIIEKVLSRSKFAMRKKELSVRERWLGVRFQKEISNGYLPLISIRYIDEVFGYGIFAEEDMAAGAYIGEYTGFIRKRRPRSDRKNDYCFEYTLGDWARNPYIIDAQKQGNFTRFINHSDDPNVESLSVYADEVMHIIFTALKPIKKGEQLCYHYGDYFWKKRPRAKKLPL